MPPSLRHYRGEEAMHEEWNTDDTDSTDFHGSEWQGVPESPFALIRENPFHPCHPCSILCRLVQVRSVEATFCLQALEVFERPANAFDQWRQRHRTEIALQGAVIEIIGD